MKLYIAEKPSLGRAIAAALPKPQKSHQGYIELANGDVVSWCIGHILEQAEPQLYDAKFAKWQFNDLPIVPNQWLLTPKAKTKSQLTILKRLIKQATHIIHAGDPDREGQLLVDEVIDYCKVSNSKKAAIQRLLISDLNLPAVKRALSSLKNNHDFAPLSISALARSRADWLYGMNLTRAYTLQGQKAGYQGVLSVGRVQTPVLGLVVARDKAISEFVSKPFYEVLAHVKTAKGDELSAKWQPSEQCQPYMDDENRVLVKALAENVIKRITGQLATVTKLTSVNKKQAAPLPYSLSALQIDAAKRHNLSAKQVLDICQQLYERHKLITYPRSDCRHLPKEQLALASDIIDMLKKANEPISQFAANADKTKVSKAWNNAKVTAHHAIVPTEKSAQNIMLSAAEQQIYQLIVRQYLAQFYPDFCFQQTDLELTIAGGRFTNQHKNTVDLGWKVLFGKPKNADEECNLSHFPPLTLGDELTCFSAELLEKMTQAPQPFNDATLLAAMTGIARYVTNSDIRKILKDTDGLGTEATRASIIDLLFKRLFLQRQGKHIVSTELGRALINTLPDMAITPDMTAQWEANLNAISEQKVSYQSFMAPLITTIEQMVHQSAEHRMQNLSKVAPKTPMKKFRRKRKKTVLSTSVE